MKNMFCEESVLTNEASVEHYFVSRLISELNYKDSQVLIKPNIDEIQISLGSNKVWYKPDYIFKRYDGTMWIIEAKSPKEIHLEKHIGQGASYCLMLNGRHAKRNPTEYFVITNGLKTLLYRWDCHNDPLIELNFEDIREENPRFQRFKKILSQNSIKLDIEVNPVSFKKKIIDPMCGSAGLLLNSYTYNKDLENVNGYTPRVHLSTVIEGTSGSSINITPKNNFADIIMADFRYEKIYNQERESKLPILNNQEYDFKISTELKIILFEELCSLLKNGGILSLILNEGFLEEGNSKEVRDFIYQNFNLISYLPYALIDNDPNVNLSILTLEKSNFT